MVGDAPPHDPGEENDLAALDFGPPDDDRTGSDRDALDVCRTCTGTGGDDAHPETVQPPDAADGECAAPVVTVTNPPGTVAVTTSLDGRVQHIDLAPKVTEMAEPHLAEEIVVIADLATRDARSAQYVAMLDGMRQHDVDDVITHDFLTRDLDLPTPAAAAARRAEVFASRYAGDDE